MIMHNKVRGTMNIVPSIEVNIDTVYVRTNITAIQTDDFDGWEYDEIQYGKDEYIATMAENGIKLASQITYTEIALVEIYETVLGGTV